MSLLDIVTGAQKKLKIPTTAAVVGSTNEDTVQLLDLANVESVLLAKRYDWQVLATEKTVTTTATETQTGAIPSDFSRLIDGSMFNRSLRKMVNGPLTPSEWQFAKMWGTGPIYPMFRIRGGALLLMPTPTAGQTIAFEYISKNTVSTAGGSLKETFTHDDDFSLLPETLIQLGIIWRWLERQGLSFDTQFQIYEDAVGRFEQDDGGRRVINMAGYGPDLPGYPMTPEGSWTF